MLDAIANEIKSTNVEEVSIIAGHYCLNPELSDLSNNGTAEISSFRFGVRLYKKLKDQSIAIKIVVWVNDIGVDSSVREVAKKNKSLPDNYKHILNKENIDANEIIVLFESSIRNRASVKIRKIYKKQTCIIFKVNSTKKGLIRCVETNNECFIESQLNKIAYAVKTPQGDDLVIKDGSNPKCNLILATLFDKIHSSNLKNSHVVNTFNDVYVGRINLGVHVFNLLYDPDKLLSFTNLYTNDNGSIQAENNLINTDGV